jgi:hypothetical protein
MTTERSDPGAELVPDLEAMRAEIGRLRDELDSIRQTAAAAAGPAGSSLIGSPMIAGQYNTVDAPTVLEGIKPMLTFGVINGSQGSGSTGAPVGVYTAVRGVGIIATAYGSAPFPVTSKAVQAYCEQGTAVVADSRDGSALFAHTVNGTSAIVADQGSGNPRSAAIVALGGAGTGLYASGQTASIQLGRSAVPGPPATGDHEAGELVLDANADLYLCKSGGTPGTWKLLG